ncbi:carotenoid biosynthesis protein [Emticicia sp. TH156]|uniref:carotenoid biosynthesis protein n=1 Tax=Emticicia sp. TH156 TaxID=2067454 RepID=UPI000C76D62A|nr:carotenoid biosynthesis protein [Emticicia sp. TH156]PLK43234.1 carotenoid biosynthesis protein [Emticicia sp. TH156]
MKNPRPYLLLLASMYLAGLIGLNMPQTTELFQALTPFNLVVSLVILLGFNQQFNRPFYIFAVVTFLTGYFIEVAGVHTGIIFGHYQYETTLGFKIIDVPPLIGANWLLLIYCIGSSFSRLSVPFIVKVSLGALSMTLLDVLIEPVAIRLNMWSWDSLQPPLQNYLAWFIVSAFLFALFFSLKFRKDNPIALWLLIFQICFFGIQNIIN